MDSQEDEFLNYAYDRFEQTGGALGPLFQFNLTPIGPRRRWRNVVERAQFRATYQQLRDPTPKDSIGLALVDALHTAIDGELRRDHRPDHHFVNFSITAHGFTHAYQSINFTVGEFLKRSLRLDELLQSLANKLNSNESFSPEHGFQVDITIVAMPGPGSGRTKHNPGRRCLEKENKKKRSIITIRNKDQLCCSRALVTMRAHCHRQEGAIENNRYLNMRTGCPVQEKEAKDLHRLAGVPEGPCGLEELKKFQEALSPHYQLLVMCRLKPFFLIFKGPEAPHQICLIKGGDHYDGCTSFSGFINRSYYCHLCEKGYNTDDGKHHSCEGRKCTACVRMDCPDYVRGTRPTLQCSYCYTRFFGQNCFTHHKKEKLCQSFKTCPHCCAHYNVVKGKKHHCGFAKCDVCGEFVKIAEHKCYIQPVAEEKEEETTVMDDDPLYWDQENGQNDCKQPPPPTLFVYADFEAMRNAEGEFSPNLLCYSTSEEDEVHVLEGEGCPLEFLHDLDDLTEVPDNDKDRPIIIIFHNLKGFDGIFIIKEMYSQQREVSDQLTMGAKVLSFTSGPLKFVDSLCFLPFPLAAFPSTFSLTELKKGWFPHLWNVPENQSYVGRVPDLEYYDPDGMDVKKREELKLWHADQVARNNVFDFHREMVDYCKSDVVLRKAGCEKFVQEFQANAGFNPFEKCVTIASACNLYWRKHHVKPDQIAVEPPQGWRGARVNQSQVALEWLYWEESKIEKEGASADRIKHVRNGGEQTVLTPAAAYFVDGFDAETNTVYEFHGCLFHGCPKCHPNRDDKHYCSPDRTLEELYQATWNKTCCLRLNGYIVKECWECEWKAEKESSPGVQTFLQSFELVPPLNPREAFFGGRTGAVALHVRAEDNQEIRYIDVTSLYPFVNKTKCYPTGHPHIITQPADQNIYSYFGIALVDILPPANLFHPVLPVRRGGKLTFPLCATCVQEEQSKPMLDRRHVCPHSDQQRMLRGTWCTPELQKAVEKGYILHKIHEVWHFPAEQQDTGLFEGYVNTWLKLKQESAGWPGWCRTEEEKQQYLSNYRAREGIQLEYRNVKKNPGRKATAKLMLNRCVRVVVGEGHKRGRD